MNTKLLAQMTMAVGYFGLAGESGTVMLKDIINEVGEQTYKEFYAALVLADQETVGLEILNIAKDLFKQFKAEGSK